MSRIRPDRIRHPDRPEDSCRASRLLVSAGSRTSSRALLPDVVLRAICDGVVSAERAGALLHCPRVPVIALNVLPILTRRRAEIRVAFVGSLSCRCPSLGYETVKLVICMFAEDMGLCRTPLDRRCREGTRRRTHGTDTLRRGLSAGPSHRIEQFPASTDPLLITESLTRRENSLIIG